MSNKQRNLEATHIHRPIATGQIRGKGRSATLEAWAIAVVAILFGINLLPPASYGAMWRA